MLSESQVAANVMHVPVRLLAAALASLTVGLHPRHHQGTRLPSDYAAWSRVATCEEGGWYAPGGFYPDALGINATNFGEFGGHPDYGRLSMRARVREIRVADRLIRYYHMGVPDQWGCAAW